jgi:hypothetical protein
MRRIILMALRVALVASVAPAVARDDVQSKANFYAQTSEGECGLEFTITNRDRPVKGSLAFTDLGLRLRLPEKGFVVVNGKLAESEGKVFSAMVAQKGLAVGFYDGTILPIDLIGLDTKPFAACIEALPLTSALQRVQISLAKATPSEPSLLRINCQRINSGSITLSVAAHAPGRRAGSGFL